MDLSQEKELVKRAQKSPEAFYQLYEDNYPKIFGYILNRVANLDAAQDIVSETFFKALKNIGSFKWKNISFSCWLYRIASNEISNYFRKDKYHPTCFDNIAEPAVLHTPHDAVVEAEREFEMQKEFMEINKLVLKLPLKYQQVISLRFFEKKKIEEICQILGKKEGTVKSLLHRAIEKLKDGSEISASNETFAIK